MMRLRIGSALAGMAVCAVAGALLWPHARDAGRILAAQDDPAELADVQLDSALRNNEAAVEQNIEAALAANDAGLAASFVELAREKNIALSDGLSKRVADAVTDANSASHFAKGFATGLVTGTADDVASLSGTVAGDLFVFGDDAYSCSMVGLNETDATKSTLINSSDRKSTRLNSSHYGLSRMPSSA